ncbi:MAG: translation elongation factor Ts [Verrucomicrobiae bacterium]|nr:translation elongation factor Ts [Verrucomicrobiae bacterium]
MKIEATTVAELRRRTNASMMDCKNALVEAQADLEKAEVILRKKGQVIAAKKASRQVKDGVVASYIHLGGKVGVLVEVNCETDFVAKNDKFKEMVKDITLQIAASSPVCVSRTDVAPDILAREKEIASAQIKGKPQNVIDKIVEGKLEKYYQTVCLMEQAFVKNPDITIKDLVSQKVAEIGENIVIRRFVRYQVGEEIGGAKPAEAAEVAPAAA